MNYDDCPQGIKNAKDIERLGDRMAIIFEQLDEGLVKLDKKLDQLDQKIEDLKNSIPGQIDKAVDAKWKTGVYGAVKWLAITVLGVLITITVKMVMGV